MFNLKFDCWFCASYNQEEKKTFILMETSCLGIIFLAFTLYRKVDGWKKPKVVESHAESCGYQVHNINNKNIGYNLFHLRFYWRYCFSQL